jgi:membrane-associated phospholipid phosphatase
VNLRSSRAVATPNRRSGPPVSLRSTWPLQWSDLGLFVLAFALISAAWVGLGFLVTGPLDNSVGDLDRRVAVSLADSRTDTWNTISHWGSMLAETFVKVLVTAVVVIVLLRRWRRWREPLLIAATLILEASCFLTITLIVGRARPDVPRLDSSPVDSSFPSGHTAAAMAYGAFAVVVFLSTRKLWPRILSVVLTLVVVLAVGLARMYRGMHFLSDVTAGVLLGLVSLTVTWFIVEHAHERHLDQALRREFG